MTDETIPLIDWEFGPDEHRAVARVLDRGRLTVGPETEAFERDSAFRLGVSDAVAVANGTAALHLAFVAAGLGAGDEVILPSLSFVAAAAMALRVGARPIFVDIVDESDLTLDPVQVLEHLSPRTKAVVAMHYGGHPAQLSELVRLCRERDIMLIEDAAHAAFLETKHGWAGTVGDIGCFSFHATKNVTTGEGGLVVARRPELLDRVRSLRSHAVNRRDLDESADDIGGYDVEDAGFNYRPNELASALGRVQLTTIDDDRVRRSELVAHYRRRLHGHVTIPFESATEPGAHHLFVVLLPASASRVRVRQTMRSSRIETSVHYPPTHHFTFYRRVVPEADVVLPVTEDVAGRLLTLPLHRTMTVAQVDRVADSLVESLEDRDE